MNVIALGGCGLMGRHFVETAIKLKAFTRLTIADRNVGAARDYALALRHPSIDSMEVDARDRVALTNVLRQYDVVVSTIGPYYLFGTAVLECAIDAGCHYIDICDDPEPTLAMLDLHAKAEAAGITAIIGMGASPGVANLLASTAIRQVGAPHRVVTTWGSTSRAKEEENADSEMGAALEHWVEQLTGRIPVFRAGEIAFGSPLAEIRLDVPGVGTVKAHTVGHPEPVTLPGTFPSIRESVNAMVLSHGLAGVLKVLQARVDKHGQTVKEAAELLHTILVSKDLSGLSFGESMYLLKRSLAETLFGRRYIPAEMAAIAEGRKGEKRHICSAWLNGEIPGGMGPNTCIPTAVALLMLARNQISKRGVSAPEAAIPADAFFGHLGPFVRLRDPNQPVVALREAFVQ
ncbi:saccharopine dehydrogenase NADP-binding domain-containing protein [Cupriavidus basilensis]|uniref:Saccharopine dehydrogenase NADP-binding domain-containing protein n=1 Tax=Cupriavidus basilensis TaxID=68895 RepID=A0ABT6AG66_9BURK|nr:saccharopine dehydrogenase NADP-binding domain-containing protein [Cupriavidus basilensis]MDF3831595.1 saccharopine dehydrogenase NADP-binding domain-containing protein [Cupriavidus basilensis]